MITLLYQKAKPMLCSIKAMARPLLHGQARDKKPSGESVFQGITIAPPLQTGSAVVCRTVRRAKEDCNPLTPGSVARLRRWMRAKSSVSVATTLRR